jgi:hypothetical protein
MMCAIYLAFYAARLHFAGQVCGKGNDYSAVVKQFKCVFCGSQRVKTRAYSCCPR